jgi:GDP-L-fucose synthase
MRVYVAGIHGMVGSAVARYFRAEGHEVLGRPSKELNLLDRAATFAELQKVKPDALVIAAAKVGGIGANSTLPVDFLTDNLQIQGNLIDGAHVANIERVLFLGSSCIYPRMAPQPIEEESLLTGPLEETNEAYAIAKIAGIKLINAYRKQYGRRWISAMPTNLYGPNDNFDFETSHVLPALIAKFHEAKQNGNTKVTLWGDGTPLREFLHVDDLAKACLVLLEKYDDSIAINVGSGSEVTIRELAEMIQKTTGFAGGIEFDTTRPNGTPRKNLSIKRIQSLGWNPEIKLEEGLASTYEWFRQNALSKV